MHSCILLCFSWQRIFPVNSVQTDYWQKMLPRIGIFKLLLAQPGRAEHTPTLPPKILKERYCSELEKYMLSGILPRNKVCFQGSFCVFSRKKPWDSSHNIVQYPQSEHAAWLCDKVTSPIDFENNISVCQREEISIPWSFFSVLATHQYSLKFFYLNP